MSCTGFRSFFTITGKQGNGAFRRRPPSVEAGQVISRRGRNSTAVPSPPPVEALGWNAEAFEIDEVNPRHSWRFEKKRTGA